MGQKASTPIVDTTMWQSRPTQLHHICGRNIQLSDDHTIAARKDGEKLHKDGLVHTAWPVAVGKVFQVTVMETAEKWTGSMVRARMGGGKERGT